MFVWLHSSSPPQHIANVHEVEVSTAAKLRAYIDRVNAQRLINVKWAGIFEDERGAVTLQLFWDKAKALAYVQRNRAKLDLILCSDDFADVP